MNKIELLKKILDYKIDEINILQSRRRVLYIVTLSLR